MKKLFVIGMIILLVGMSNPSIVTIVTKSYVVSTDSNTLYVGGEGPGNYTQIQDAIDDASNRDTVFVYDESSPYYERIEIDKTINLIGEDRDTTEIILGGNIITLSADFINISGFSITNFWGNSLYICSSYNSISYNNFSGFDYYEPEDHTGIEISNYNNYNLISNNNFYNLNATSIDVSPNCNHTTIINNTFFDNQDDIIIRSFCHNTTIIGNKVLGNDGYSSIYIIESNNSIIKDNYVTPPDSWTGIRIYSSHDNIIDNNTIIGIKGSCGIHLWNSYHNNMYDNYMYNCGLIVINSFHNSVVNNIVNNKSLVYLEGYSDLIITNDSGQIVLVNCDNITVQMQNLSCTSWGIALLETTNCSISDCFFSHIGRGISIEYSNNNIIMNNYFEDSGIVIDNSQNNLIKDNNFTKKHVGILFYRANYNTITNNTIAFNSIGIDLNDGCTRNNILNNIISNQNWYGIKISYDCYNNIIYHNEFSYNEYNAKDAGSNTWDDGYPSGGNFWDDYNGADSDGDGIGDTPYPIPGGNNQDRYPLMEPYNNETESFFGTIGPICPFLNIVEIEIIDGNESQIEKIEKILNNRILHFIIPRFVFINVTDLDFKVSYTKKIPKKIPFFWKFAYLTFLEEYGNQTLIDEPHIVTVKGLNGLFGIDRGKLIILFPPHFIFEGDFEEVTIEYLNRE